MGAGFARTGLMALAAGVIFAACAFAAAIMTTHQQGAVASQHRAVAVTTEPVAFDPGDPTARTFGKLTYLGGIAVSSTDRAFGGISGIVMAPDGRRFVAVTDVGDWLTGSIGYKDGAISGLSKMIIAPIRGAPGESMERKRESDAEGLAPAGPKGIDGDLLVSFERNHRIARYPFAAKGPQARPDYVKLPADTARLEANQGIEAVGLFPKGTRLAGGIIAIAEQLLDADYNHTGWLIGGPAPGKFMLKRHDFFDITDLNILPGGDVLLLERRYSPLTGPAMRLRRIAAEAIGPGALLDGEVLLEAALPYSVDNMEGLGVHARGDGTLVLTIVSDDNFRSVQRTLFLQFALGR